MWGAGDVTWTLKEILAPPEFKSEDRPYLSYDSLPGADLVKEAIKEGVGGKVSAYAGMAVDDRFLLPFA